MKFRQEQTLTECGQPEGIVYCCLGCDFETESFADIQKHIKKCPNRGLGQD